MFGCFRANTYDNSNWKDLLTSYNGQSITYDPIGNPLTYGGTTFTWQNGRRLATISKSGIMNAAYTYNVDGIRTKKVVNGVTTDYYLNGSNIVTQVSGNDRLDFAYDESGNLYGFIYNNRTYSYIKNAQNDIIGIIDDCGDLMVSYEYDAWGNINITEADINLGKLNPFRYRGYYFDSESGYYYLQSRYYSPEWGRFINADSTTDGNAGVLGYNQFIYCANNPVNNCTQLDNF